MGALEIRSLRLRLRVKSRVKSRRVVEKRLTVIRVMAAVTECILRWQRFLELQLMLAMKKCVYVCMCVCTCRPMHLWMFVYI